MMRPNSFVKEEPLQEQGDLGGALNGQTLNEATKGLTLSQKEAREAPKGEVSKPAKRFKELFAGRNLKEAVAILVPNINHALKMGSTAHKNEPLIQAMMAEHRSLKSVSAALKSLTQNTGTGSLTSQRGTNTQNQNAV